MSQNLLNNENNQFFLLPPEDTGRPVWTYWCLTSDNVEAKQLVQVTPKAGDTSRVLGPLITEDELCGDGEDIVYDAMESDCCLEIKDTHEMSSLFPGHYYYAFCCVKVRHDGALRWMNGQVTDYCGHDGSYLMTVRFPGGSAADIPMETLLSKNESIMITKGAYASRWMHKRPCKSVNISKLRKNWDILKEALKGMELDLSTPGLEKVKFETVFGKPEGPNWEQVDFLDAKGTPVPTKLGKRSGNVVAANTSNSTQRTEGVTTIELVEPDTEPAVNQEMANLAKIALGVETDEASNQRERMYTAILSSGCDQTEAAETTKDNNNVGIKRRFEQMLQGDSKESSKGLFNPPRPAREAALKLLCERHQGKTLHELLMEQQSSTRIKFEPHPTVLMHLFRGSVGSRGASILHMKPMNLIERFPPFTKSNMLNISVKAPLPSIESCRYDGQTIHWAFGGLITFAHEYWKPELVDALREVDNFTRGIFVEFKNGFRDWGLVVGWVNHLVAELLRRFLSTAPEGWNRALSEFRWAELSASSNVFQTIMYRAYNFGAEARDHWREDRGNNSDTRGGRKSKYKELLALDPKVKGRPICFKHASGYGCEEAMEDGSCPIDPKRIHSTKVSKHVMNLLRETFKSKDQQ